MSNKKSVDPRELLEDMLGQDYKVVSTGGRTITPSRVALAFDAKGNIGGMSRLLTDGSREDVSVKYLESFAQRSLLEGPINDAEIAGLLEQFGFGSEENSEDVKDLSFYDSEIYERRMEVARLELEYQADNSEDLKTELLLALQKLREVEEDFLLWEAEQNVDAGKSDMDWEGPLTEDALKAQEYPEDYPYVPDMTLSFEYDFHKKIVSVKTSTGDTFTYLMEESRRRSIQKLLRDQDLPVVMQVLHALTPPLLIHYRSKSVGAFVLKGYEYILDDMIFAKYVDSVLPHIQKQAIQINQDNPWTSEDGSSLYYSDIMMYVNLAQTVSAPLYGIDYSVRQFIQHLSATLKPQHEQITQRPTTRVIVEDDVLKALQEVLSGMVGSDTKLLGENSIVDMVLQRLETKKGEG